MKSKNTGTRSMTRRATLAAARDVVKTNVYVFNLKPADIALHREIRGAFFPVDPPASTLVGVTALATPDYLVEIEAIAAVE